MSEIHCWCLVMADLPGQKSLKCVETSASGSFAWFLACEILTTDEQKQFGCQELPDKQCPFAVLKRKRGFADEESCRSDLDEFINVSRAGFGDGCLDKDESVNMKRLYECLVNGKRRYITIVDRDPYTEDDWKRGGFSWYQVMPIAAAENAEEITRHDMHSLFCYSKVSYEQADVCFVESPDPKSCEYCNRDYQVPSIIVIDDMGEK